MHAEKQFHSPTPSSKMTLILFAMVTATFIWFSYVHFTDQLHIFRWRDSFNVSVRVFGQNISRNLSQRRLQHRHHHHHRQRRKVILFWTPFFSSNDYGFGLGAEPFLLAKCQVCNCETTTNRSRLEEADAIILHIRNLIVEKSRTQLDLPPFRCKFSAPNLTIYFDLFRGHARVQEALSVHWSIGLLVHSNPVK